MSAIKRLLLFEFTLGGRDLVSVVRISRIRESPYYTVLLRFFFIKKIYENFVGTVENCP